MNHNSLTIAGTSGRDASGSGGQLAQVLFDRRFKNVNDTYGHPTGDLVLRP